MFFYPKSLSLCRCRLDDLRAFQSESVAATCTGSRVPTPRRRNRVFYGARSTSRGRQIELARRVNLRPNTCCSITTHFKTNQKQCFFPNTLHDLVKTEPWRVLHAAVGDYVMRYLLTHCAIFVSLPNRNYMQVCVAPYTHHFRNGSYFQSAQISSFPSTSHSSWQALHSTGTFLGTNGAQYRKPRPQHLAKPSGETDTAAATWRWYHRQSGQHQRRPASARKMRLMRQLPNLRRQPRQP